MSDAISWNDLLGENEEVENEDVESLSKKTYGLASNSANFEDILGDDIVNTMKINPFERDYESIVSSPEFRALQDKTQVYPLSKSDFVRTRLTHSLEVSTIARQLGTLCCEKFLEEGDDKVFKTEEIETVLACAGLLHDVGNPPFGHVGEDLIREWFSEHLTRHPETLYYYISKEDLEESTNENEENHESDKIKKIVGDVLKKNMNMIWDFEHFEGNAQAIRILCKSRYESGINTSAAVISTIIKYPTTSGDYIKAKNDNDDSLFKHKLGYYHSEEKVVEDSFYIDDENICGVNEIVSVDKGKRHPLAYLLEAADDIAYMTADLEDAVKVGLLSADKLYDFLSEKFCELVNKNLNIDPEYKVENARNLNDEKKGEYQKKFHNHNIKQPFRSQLKCTCRMIDILGHYLGIAPFEIDDKEEFDFDSIAIPGHPNDTEIVNEWGAYVRMGLMYVAYRIFLGNIKQRNKETKEMEVGPIMLGRFEEQLLEADNAFHKYTVKFLREAMEKYVYDKPMLVEPEVAAREIITFLLDKFVPAAIRKNMHAERTETDKLAYKLIPQALKDDYKKEIEELGGDAKAPDAEKVYHSILMVTDYISGMTDNYAKDLYRKLSGAI